MISSSSSNHLLSLGNTQRMSWGERVRRFPWSLLLLLSVTAGLGFGVLYSAVGGQDNIWLFWRQIVQFGIGVGIMGSVALVAGEKIYRRFAYLF